MVRTRNEVVRLFPPAREEERWKTNFDQDRGGGSQRADSLFLRNTVQNLCPSITLQYNDAMSLSTQVKDTSTHAMHVPCAITCTAGK